MTQQVPEFEDAALQAALKRAAGASRASDALRRRVAQLAAETRDEIVGAPSVVAKIDRRPNRPWRRYAAAAVVVLIAGLAALNAYRQHQNEIRRQEILAANYEALDPMAESHEDWTLPDDAQMLDWSPSPESLAIELSRKLGRTIPPVKLDKLGWEFADASVQKLGEHRAARLRFTRNQGKERLTVFSLPANAIAEPKDESDYAYLIDDHAIAGYVRDGSVNCVVCDEGVPMDEAVKLREAIRKG